MTHSQNDRLWLLKVAWSLTNDESIIDDLAQEGNIEMWRAGQKWTPECGIERTAFVRAAARMRMMKCAHRRHWTGQPDMRGHQRPVEQGMPSEAEEMFSESDHIDQIMLAYHHGEIFDALAKLTPSQREKVIRRFWMDEVMPPGGWWFGPKGARTKLRESLAHLMEV